MKTDPEKLALHFAVASDGVGLDREGEEAAYVSVDVSRSHKPYPG
jgi:hypothetical protein